MSGEHAQADDASVGPDLEIVEFFLTRSSGTMIRVAVPAKRGMTASVDVAKDGKLDAARARQVLRGISAITGGMDVGPGMSFRIGVTMESGSVSIDVSHSRPWNMAVQPPPPPPSAARVRPHIAASATAPPYTRIAPAPAPEPAPAPAGGGTTHSPGRGKRAGGHTDPPGKRPRSTRKKLTDWQKNLIKSLASPSSTLQEITTVIQDLSEEGRPLHGFQHATIIRFWKKQVKEIASGGGAPPSAPDSDDEGPKLSHIHKGLIRLHVPAAIAKRDDAREAARKLKESLKRSMRSVTQNDIVRFWHKTRTDASRGSQAAAAEVLANMSSGSQGGSHSEASEDELAGESKTEPDADAPASPPSMPAPAPALAPAPTPPSPPAPPASEVAVVTSARL